MKVADILKLNNDQRKLQFKAHGIDKVVIDGNEFTDYAAFSFLREKSYVKSPERSGDGSITNLNSYAFFLTPHLKIDFSLLSIDSYRKLMELIYRKNEFLVECYDVVKNATTVNKMYFTTEELPKLWTIARAVNGEEWVELLGVEEYSVEMVGTNASLEETDILYYDNDGNLIADATQTATIGTDAVVGYNFQPNAGYRFDGEWETENGGIVRNGDAILVNGEIKLFAKVVPTNQYTLSIDYGIGIKPQPQNTTENVDTFVITKGQTINAAIVNKSVVLANGNIFTFPSGGTGVEKVKYKGKEYNPYYFDGWGWSPQKSNNSSPVLYFTEYNYDFNRTIYQYYGITQYQLTFDTMVSSISLKSLTVKYGERVSLPTLYDGDKKTKGWYWLNDGEETEFDGIMPPFSLTIYAKWE